MVVKWVDLGPNRAAGLGVYISPMNITIFIVLVTWNKAQWVVKSTGMVVP